MPYHILQQPTREPQNDGGDRYPRCLEPYRTFGRVLRGITYYDRNHDYAKDEQRRDDRNKHCGPARGIVRGFNE